MEGNANTPTSSSEPTDSETKPDKKTRMTKMLIVILVLLLLGALGYLYYEENNKSSDLETEIAQLKQASTTSQSAEANEMNNTSSEEAIESEPCVAGSNYTATIGKFTVTLDSPSVIVRNLDAGFEGGPITSLDIATCLPVESNVYDSPPQNEVSILAHPSSSSSDLRSSYESQNGSLTADGTVTVAGVTASKYVLSALFETTLYYFDNAGIGYQIELADTNTTTNSIFTDMTSDWAFTP